MGSTPVKVAPPPPMVMLPIIPPSACRVPVKCALVPVSAPESVVAPDAASEVAETDPPDWLPLRLPLKLPLNVPR
jgi:hypothetical protein